MAEEPKGETIGAQLGKKMVSHEFVDYLCFLERINREASEAESFAQKRVEKDLYSANW